MPPKNPAGGAAQKVTSWTASQAQTSNTSRTQGEPPEPSFDDDLDDGLEGADVTQLREQIQVLTRDQRNDRDMLERILVQLTALTAAQTPLPQDPVRSVERDASISTDTQDRIPRYSKKQPDPQPLSDGVDPTFESWKLQIQGKFRVNADHFEDEEAKMFYLFNRTTGDAQKHLQPRYDDNSQTRFVSATEMVQHLATIYVNPNKVRDAKYDYNHLMMRTGQTFAEFQTQFLHLAGEAQIPMESLRLDLYDKLTTPLQEKLAVNLRTLDTFAELSASCLSLDTELRRIAVRVDRQKRNRDSRTSAPTVPIIPAALERAKPVAPTTPRPSLPIYTRAPSQTPQNSNLRQSTPVDPTVTCFNCHRIGHYASSCPEPKRTDLKEIEEDLSEESGKEESGKEEP